MTRYQYEEPVKPDLECPWTQQPPWIRQRLEQLEAHFRDFLTSKEGRFYVLFGGRYAGKTSLLEIIRQRPPEPGRNALPVLIDLATAGALSSSPVFFQLLFQEIRKQLGVCYIEPEEAAQLFKGPQLALPDFKRAFDYIVRSPESKVGGARVLLLLDNADELAQVSFAPELFIDLIRLFSDATYIQHVTSQLDVVVTGGVPLYNQLLEANFPRKLKHWYNIEVLPDDATQALIADLPAIRNQPDLIREALCCTGRHPYLLQCFMAHVEDLISSGQPVTSATMEKAATACLQSRGKVERWFHECFQAIQEQGASPVYAALAATGRVMTWEQIQAAIQAQAPGNATQFSDPVTADRALDTLLFHGLVRCEQADETSGYVITSELFRKWFFETQKAQELAPLRTELLSAQTQLKEARENLLLIRERKSQFVMGTDVPLDMIKRERELEQQIAGLEKQIAGLKTPQAQQPPSAT